MDRNREGAGNEPHRIEPGRTVHEETELEASGLDGAEGGSKSILADQDHEERQAVTIVVADDDPQIRDFLRTILTDAGYQVLEAKNGREAVQQVETSDVHLVITDLAMPEQEGIETIQKLHGLRPQLKIIAMSGRFPRPLLRMSEHLGAQESLAKPIDPDELLDAVARVMAGCAPRA